MAVAEIAHHATETLEIPVPVLKCHCDDVGPELRAVFFDLQRFGANVTFDGRPFQACPQLVECIRTSVDKGNIPTKHVSFPVTVNALSSLIPGDDLPLCVEQKEGEVLH